METRDGALWAVLLAVGTGAALGACGRWALSYVFNNRIALLPLGTLLCNLLGGLLIGALTAWFSTHLQVSPMWRLFLVTGLLGGLTTFSTFGRRRADDDGWRLAASFGAQRLASVRLVCCHRRGFCGCQTIDGLVF